MQCPKCYNKIKKEQTRCQHCGFDISIMDGASNKAAKKAKKTIYKDDILYTTEIPYDVSKKKLFLFSIFLGLFGVHHFYVGKFWLGLYMCVSTSVTLILSILITSFNIIDAKDILYSAFQFSLVFQGVNVIMWVVDMIRIFFERYKIPVYKKSFSDKK